MAKLARPYEWFTSLKGLSMMRPPKISVPELLTQRSFRWYWGASTISTLGDGVSYLAIPLTAAVTLHANPMQMGFLSALTWLPSLLFALHAGAWVDRYGHRRITMIAANLGSFAVLVSIPICYASGVLSLWQLYGSVFLTGTFSMLFNVSDNTLFVSLVRPDQYLEGQSLLYGSQAASSLAGPSIGGILVQTLMAPFAVIADALSFLISALMLKRINPTEPPPDTTQRAGALAEGIRFILGSETVRTTLAVAATVNLFNLIFHTLVVLYFTINLHMSSGVIGLMFAGEATGGLVGAAVTKRTAQRIGVGRALLVGSVSISAPLVIVPLVHRTDLASYTLLALALFGSGFGRTVQNISIGSVFAVEVPDRLRSRARGAFQMVSFGCRPIGAVIGGLLGTIFGLRATLWISALGGCLVIALLLPSKLMAFRIQESRAAAS